MITRRIFFSQLALDAHIGILTTNCAQRNHCTLTPNLMCRQQDVNDQQLQTVLDYRLLRNAIVTECTRAHINLLETLIERVMDRILDEFPDVLRVKLRISKPLAFSDCNAVGIEAERTRPTPQ